MFAISPTWLDTAVDLATISIVLVALSFIVRQKLNKIFDAKVVLVIVYVAFLGGMLLELLRDFTTDPGIITGATFGEIGFILLIVLLLTGVSYTFYVRPPEPRFSQRLRGMFAPGFRVHLFVQILVGAYFLFLESYLILYRPFTIVDVQVEGAAIATPRFDDTYLVLLSVVLAVYILYPLRLFLLGARAARYSEVRRALLVLPTSWIAVGAILLVFNGLLPGVNPSFIIVGHVVLGMTFAVTAVVFRNVSLLGRMFEPMAYVIPVPVPVFTSALHVDPSSISGTSMLLAFDPSAKYEDAVEDFIVEQLSKKNLVYVFTTATSPVMAAVSNLPEVRFFLLTDSVSYAEPTNESHKTLVPLKHPDVIVDVTAKILAANVKTENSVVFDNISAMIGAMGEEATLKLLHRMLEALDGGKVTSLFLIMSGTHYMELMAAVGRLFGRRLFCDSAGLREIKN